MSEALPGIQGPSGREIPGYFDLDGSQVYHVLHVAAAGPKRGMAVIAGPFGAERERAYTTCVRWARLLASCGFDALRFDYRGMGESTGRFENMTFSAWREDLETCVGFMRLRDAHAPIVLHGVRAGAIPASEAFHAGYGDALLLWAPPPGARGHLWDVLRRTLTSDMLANPDAPRKTRETYIAEMEAGTPITIDGYYWTRALWQEAVRHPLNVPGQAERRPWKSIDVNPSARAAADTMPGSDAQRSPARIAAVQSDRFWEGQGRIIPRTQALFAASVAWLDTAIEVLRAVAI